MNGNIELLDFVYQNSQMGVETIKQLVKISEDENFLKQLYYELDIYEKVNKKAEKLINMKNSDEKGISVFEKMTTYLMINMKTISDKSSSHIAKMMIIGSNMGIINAIENIKKYSNADKEILILMKELLDFEEDNVKKLKNFL